MNNIITVTNAFGAALRKLNGGGFWLLDGLADLPSKLTILELQKIVRLAESKKSVREIEWRSYRLSRPFSNSLSEVIKKEALNDEELANKKAMEADKELANKAVFEAQNLEKEASNKDLFSFNGWLFSTIGGGVPLITTESRLALLRSSTLWKTRKVWWCDEMKLQNISFYQVTELLGYQPDLKVCNLNNLEGSNMPFEIEGFMDDSGKIVELTITR